MIDPDDAIEFADNAWVKAGYDLRALQPALQVVQLINWLNFETILGGVYGWLINKGYYGPDTARALETVGAHQCAAIVREILAFFPESTPTTNDRERVQQMEDIGEAGETSWRELGNRLLTWPDDIYALLEKFIAEHEADFT
ncbi:MAG: DUF4375 domain-containing protein [Byssovorax sp.]